MSVFQHDRREESEIKTEKERGERKRKIAAARRRPMLGFDISIS